MATIRSYSSARAVWPVLLTRTSYQVGRPWMVEGNRFLPDTGIPMRKMACMSSPLALAEPVPLTLASLRAKSLILTILSRCTVLSRVRKNQIELLHVPGRRRTPFGAQAAVHADVFVLDHHPGGLGYRSPSDDVLILVLAPRRHPPHPPPP